jgi:hypothetical protein
VRWRMVVVFRVVRAVVRFWDLSIVESLLIGLVRTLCG